MIHELMPQDFPKLLREIPDPPKKLRYEGTLPSPEHKLLTVVGSRKYTHYGREVCESVISGLGGLPISIISGLAIGIDSIAHRAALQTGLQTIAIPGSGLARQIIYPHSHVGLADEIVRAGGCLISEYDDLTPAGKWTFPRRNRIMAGMSHAVLVVEGERKSGTLITSRLATEYNREVGAIPGPLTSPSSDGPHFLIRLGATLVRDSDDVRELLGFNRTNDKTSNLNMDDLSAEEKVFMSILDKPMARNDVIRLSKMDTGTATAILIMLEIKGLIAEELGEIKKVI